MIEIIRWILICISLPLLVLMILRTIKRAKALSTAIEEYKEEQEAAKSQPGPINPYAAISALYEESKSTKPAEQSGK